MNNNTLKEQIAQTKLMIDSENKTIGLVPEFLKDSVVPKKMSLIDALQKKIVSLEKDLAKEQAVIDKEAKERPFKTLLSEIANLKSTLDQRRNALAVAQGQFETNRDKNKAAEVLMALKAASESFYGVESDIKVKTSEVKKMKESMKG